MLDEMTLTVGQLTANVSILTKSVDKLNQYLEEQEAVVHEHDGRLARLEDCQRRNTEHWRILVGAAVAIAVGVAGAWLKVVLLGL